MTPLFIAKLDCDLTPFFQREQNAGPRTTTEAEVAESYVRSHPELSTVMMGFLQFVLLNKPNDIIAFAAEYFNTTRTDGAAPTDSTCDRKKGVKYDVRNLRTNDAVNFDNKIVNSRTDVEEIATNESNSGTTLTSSTSAVSVGDSNPIR